MRPGVANQPINMLPLIYTSLLLGCCGEIAGVLPMSWYVGCTGPTGMGGRGEGLEW